MYGYTYVCIIAHTYIYTLKAHAFLLFFGAPRLFRFFKKSANKYPSCVHAYILYIGIYAYICVGTYERTLFSYIRQNNTRQHGISNIWKRVLCLCLFLFLFNLRACVCVCVSVFRVFVSGFCYWIAIATKFALAPLNWKGFHKSKPNNGKRFRNNPITLWLKTDNMPT